MDRSYVRATSMCHRGNITVLDGPLRCMAVLVSNFFAAFLSLYLCGGFPCSCPADVGVAAARPCNREVQITHAAALSLQIQYDR